MKYGHYLYLTIIIVCIAVLVLGGIANWTYPEGEMQFAGTPDAYRLPSPSYNPLWVRILQDNGLFGFWLPMAIIILAGCKFSKVE
jgi:hypothetical protein